MKRGLPQMFNKMKKLLIIPLALIASATYAEDIVNGIDLDKVNWPELCPKVQPIVFDQNGLYCEVSHPASKIHNSKVHEIISEKLPFVNNCESLEEEFTTLTTPQDIEGQEWLTCYLVFKSALYDRLTRPDRYQHSTEDWIKVHFNEETMKK